MYIFYSELMLTFHVSENEHSNMMKGNYENIMELEFFSPMILKKLTAAGLIYQHNFSLSQIEICL